MAPVTPPELDQAGKQHQIVTKIFTFIKLILRTFVQPTKPQTQIEKVVDIHVLSINLRKIILFTKN